VDAVCEGPEGLRNDGGDAAQSWRRARVLEDDADPSHHPRLDRAERRLEHEAAAVRVLVDTGEVVAVDEEAALLEVDSVDPAPVSLRVTRAVASVAQRTAEAAAGTGTAAKAKSSSASAATSTRSGSSSASASASAARSTAARYSSPAAVIQ